MLNDYKLINFKLYDPKVQIRRVTSDELTKTAQKKPTLEINTDNLRTEEETVYSLTPRTTNFINNIQGENNENALRMLKEKIDGLKQENNQTLIQAIDQSNLENVFSAIPEQLSFYKNMVKNGEGVHKIIGISDYNDFKIIKDFNEDNDYKEIRRQYVENFVELVLTGAESNEELKALFLELESDNAKLLFNNLFNYYIKKAPHFIEKFINYLRHPDKYDPAEVGNLVFFFVECFATFDPTILAKLVASSILESDNSELLENSKGSTNANAVKEIFSTEQKKIDAVKESSAANITEIKTDINQYFSVSAKMNKIIEHVMQNLNSYLIGTTLLACLGGFLISTSNTSPAFLVKGIAQMYTGRNSAVSEKSTKSTKNTKLEKLQGEAVSIKTNIERIQLEKGGILTPTGEYVVMFLERFSFASIKLAKEIFKAKK